MCSCDLTTSLSSFFPLALCSPFAWSLVLVTDVRAPAFPQDWRLHVIQLYMSAFPSAPLSICSHCLLTLTHTLYICIFFLVYSFGAVSLNNALKSHSPQPFVLLLASHFTLQKSLCSRHSIAFASLVSFVRTSVVIPVQFPANYHIFLRASVKKVFLPECSYIFGVPFALSVPFLLNTKLQSFTNDTNVARTHTHTQKLTVVSVSESVQCL